MKKTKNSPWQIWVDTGGTFTDCLALDPSHKIHRTKVLSSSSLRGFLAEIIAPDQFRIDVKWNVPQDFIRGFRFRLLESEHTAVEVRGFDPESGVIQLNDPYPIEKELPLPFEVQSPEEAPLLAARLATGVTLSENMPDLSMRLATTRGTNALLERRGTPTVLFITRGFGDLLVIGNQQRPDLFALNIEKPHPFYQAVIEVNERLSADGKVVHDIDLEELGPAIQKLLEQGIRTAAIALFHSYINPIHERRLAEFLRTAGFNHISCSSEIAPFIKIVPRAETAVVDATLSPIIDDYLSSVQRPLDQGQLHVMTSAGGMMQPKSYHAKDSLLSGPAGGVVGAARAGERSGYTRVLAFDMGGTSTDVARYDGDYDYVFEHEVGDAHLVAPALAVESVAAGGGSICGFDGYELHVGPESGGANPGPACYGAGGPLTLTDVNLLLGRLDENRFEIPIDKSAAQTALVSVLHQITKRNDEILSEEKLLEGFMDIACERMADAIRRISIRKGYNPTEYALVAFGGAGGQFACRVAALLNVSSIVIPQDASLLSALGLGYAVIERFAERQILNLLDDILPSLPKILDDLTDEAFTALEEEGIARTEIEIRRRIINLRLKGQDSTLQIEYGKDKPLSRAFHDAYISLFGHWPENRHIEVESIRVVASSTRAQRGSEKAEASIGSPKPIQNQYGYFGGKWQDVPLFDRGDITHGARITGPALIVEQHSMTVIEPGWIATIDSAQALILKKTEIQRSVIESEQPELVRLELFTNRFGAIAQEMGEMLRKTAMSTNVKERLDFSCALLDDKGELVVNAPHIPVHLGSLGLCVRELRTAIQINPGDVIVTNHPHFGGSHLPDVTVVTPVHMPDGKLLGYVANRAHHAEIGGIRPGSMPPNARCLGDEGVVIPPFKLMEDGVAKWTVLRQILEQGRYPSRAVEENLADLRAAVAANRSGASALIRLAEEHSRETVHHYMNALKDHAESKIRYALKQLADGEYQARETLDDGSPICVTIKKSGDTANIDFTGTGDIHPMNLNATPAIVNSAVIYILRLLLNEPLPLNEGLMRSVTVHIPNGMLNPHFPDDVFEAPAVVGGNVETSQRIVDTMLKALGLSACSQGTMNNTLFGSDTLSYYETVCGGCGAGPDFDGASGVHSHMTNTRITDPEILEHRYPVRLDKFGLRHNSGGSGFHQGGDGVVREMTFLEPMSLSVLGQHRKEGPFGIKGGKPGEAAEQVIVRKSGTIQALKSIDGTEVEAGDRMILKTPGGGGYGQEEQ